MAGARKALDNAIYAKLVADTTLATILGATSGDLRIYPAYDKGGEHAVTATMPGFVTIHPITDGNPDLAIRPHIYQVTAVGRQRHIAQNIADRIDTTLHGTKLTTTGWTGVSMLRVGGATTYQDEDGVWLKPLDYETKQI